MKRTKIVCTIGPASESKTKIEQMVKAGLNVARLNFSHGTYEHHRLLINNVRAVSQKLNKPLAILQDLQGPRIRIGNVAKEGINVAKGQKIFLVPENFKIALKDVSTFIPVQYPDLYKDVKAGQDVLIDDAKISLKILAVKGKAIEAQVKIGDVIKSHKGMNFPKSEIRTSPITAKDKADLVFGLKQNVDFVALSFVKDASDIINLRKIIHQLESRLGKKVKDFKKPKRGGDWPGTHTKIIAKIERPEAVSNFEEIIKAADGIMVARGDLGLEVPLEDLPMIQKKIVRRCIQESKPVIIATQMLDSMIRYPVPTRAEVSDVANAILDGTDAIMLSGETATGQYPLKAVRVMSKIAGEVEGMEMEAHEQIENVLKKMGGITEVVSYSVQDLAEEIGASLVVCTTTSGYTPRAIAKYRSKVPIIALAVTEKTRNQLCLSWGVKSYHLALTPSFNELVLKIRRLLAKEKLVVKGDNVVLAASHPHAYLGQTNVIKVETI